MRFEQNGTLLWYGTPDAPAPGELVPATPSGRAIGINLTIGVQPIAARNTVVVHYRVNGGAEKMMQASLARTDVRAEAQYFVSRFPELNVGDTVEYSAVCSCPGRQVPSRDDEKRFPSSFRVVQAQAASVPSSRLSQSAPEPAPPSGGAADRSAKLFSHLSGSVPEPIARAVSEVPASRSQGPPGPGDRVETFTVNGRVTGPLRAGVGGLRVRVVDKNVGRDTELAEAVTDRGGEYQATFTAEVRTKLGKDQPDLQARVYTPEAGTFLGASDVRYNATDHEILNVLLPDAAAAALPSEHETLTGATHYIPAAPLRPVDSKSRSGNTQLNEIRDVPPEEKSPDETAPGRLLPIQKPVEPATPPTRTEAAIQAAVDTSTTGDRPSVATKASPAAALEPTRSTFVFQPESGAAGLHREDKDPVRPASQSGLKALQPEKLAELKGSTSTLLVSVAPEAGVEVPAPVGPVFLDVVYTRALGGEAAPGLADLPDTVQETVRAALDEKLRGTLELADVAPASHSIVLDFLAANGSVRLRKTISPGGQSSSSLSTRSGMPLAVALSAGEVAAIVAPEPHPKPSTPLVDRRAYFVPVDDQRVPFEGSTLQIAPVSVGNGGWKTLGFDQLFLADKAITTAVQWNGALPTRMGALPWTSFHLAVDGRFRFSFPEGSGDAWLWWLSGPRVAIGVVLDDLHVVRVVALGVALPPFSGAVSSGAEPTRVPTDVTEAEVAANPHVYTEDPGAFCKPFQNPERVLSERSFFVILRAEQPVISAQASVQQDPLPTLGVMDPVGPVRGIIVDPVPGALIDDGAEGTFVRHALPIAYLDALRRLQRGRTELDAAHPIQWEGDVSRYQATTVARGHIVEFRMRWRSNGYSLGTVAKTLTLAPRQTRYLEKIEYRRSELGRRQETTRLFDQVSDTLVQARDYDDSVQANLSEWARGESESSMAAGAGGAGFAMGGFVIGGGGGGSNASSSSSQEGGRRTTASEEQRLRDSVRRYGDALRKLDSLVVNEVTQEEMTTGTTEVVRNANYGHSLTVIYYQILRHLKIETGVAGVRECLFVPFAITPFTVPRAYRWRECIQRRLRDPQYAGAVKYLKDVMTGFANSDVPPGRRSEQRVRYIFGSLFIKLAIERPRDKEDGSFDPATWAVVRPYLGAPALAIYNRLKALEEAQRDAVFQQQYAGVIAAGWVNTLQISASSYNAGGIPLHADFTLATRYQFNGVARVDFSVAAPPAGVTRETLASICVKAGAGKHLPPGSVAYLQSLNFTYQTDQFQRVVSASQGAEDLVAVETGATDPNGATIGTIPDNWERRDVRAEMMYAVQGLVEHLNEHVEYYTKAILWCMDRDRLFMLIDGFYVPGMNRVSIASVVERDPIAIIGNAVVFRVSAGSFLGLGDIRTPQELFNHYITLDSPSEPMLVSLPTDGLYAQTIMDECGALEEHFGNIDWVLNDPDPALGQIAPELLASRRAEPQPTQPTPLPQTLINLQNAPEAPAPSGLAGALSAVTTPNAFRDMAGLAGTQANAAAAFQTAANLATNFGNQAAALKLAEMASKAHDTQTADQKLASVQRAADKNLVTGEEAQRHASQILESLHAPSAPSRPHQDPTLSQAIFAASGKPGSTIQATTPEGQVLVSLASNTAGGVAGGAAAAAPAATTTPAPLPRRVDGIDIYDGNTMPSTDKLNKLGISFVIHKSSDGAGHDDTRYQTRRDAVRASGITYGSFHFFRFWTAATLDDSVAAQVKQVVKIVQRLLPGELGPSLDFEETSWNDEKLGHINKINPWTPQQWVDAIQKYFDGVETALGRTPIIYTSWQVWHQAVEDNNQPSLADTDIDPDTSFLRNYPLWVKMYYDPPSTRYTDRLTRLPDELRDLPTPWLDWAIWQYSDVKPTELTDLEAKTDMDVTHGTIYQLRGMADLDHTAPHTSGNLTFIAYAQPDGRVHLLTNFGFWTDWNLFNDITPQPPLAGGDPAAAVVGDEQVIIYRDRNGHIQALSRTISAQTAGWTVTDVTSATGAPAAADDPFLTVIQNQLHAVYWETNDHQVHLSRTGDWHVEDLTGIAAGAPSASGSGVVYAQGNNLHAVSRADVHGHLFDLAGVGGGSTDLTASAHVTAGPVPAATYRPAVYTPSGGAPRIVFRALRGDIWQIERDTLNATNLSAMAGHAPAAAGSPSAIVSDTAHLFYRTLDDTLIEMFDDAGTWRRRTIRCDAIPAADPTSFVNSNGQAAVSFRTVDGAIHVATLVQGSWVCEETAPPQTASVADT